MITNKIPLVSVVMSCYNSEKFIADAIKTVANQTYRNWELIIVNDFSTDNSMRIVKKSIERFGIRYIDFFEDLKKTKRKLK